MDVSSLSHFQMAVPIKRTAKYDSDHIFEIFKRFSEDIPHEILGRHLWNRGCLVPTSQALLKLEGRNRRRLLANKPPKQKMTMYILNGAEKVCGMTHDALMIALFGPKYDQTIPKNLSSIHLDQLKATMIKQEISLSRTLDYWSVYSIRIIGGKGHALLVVQARKDNQVAYRLYQSYVKEYTLQEYLQKHNADLTRSEIFLMLDEIDEYVKTKHFNATTAHLFRHFFKVNADQEIGDVISQERRLHLKWGEVARQDFKENAEKFRTSFPSNVKIKISKAKSS